MIREWEEQSHSAPTPTSLKLWQRTHDGVSMQNSQQTSLQDMYISEERKRYIYIYKGIDYISNCKHHDYTCSKTIMKF